MKVDAEEEEEENDQEGYEKGPKKKKKIRDQCKSKKFNEIWEGLPEGVQAKVRGMSKRQKTDFTHAVITRDASKLVLVKSILYENQVKEIEESGDKELMDGCIYAEAVKRVDGPQALKEAVSDGSIFVKKIGGLQTYFFPKFQFGKSRKKENTVTATKMKEDDDVRAWEQAEMDLDTPWHPGGVEFKLESE